MENSEVCEDPQGPIPEQKTSLCNKCESQAQSHRRQLEESPPRNDKSCCYLFVICILFVILAICAALLLDSQDKLANCQNEKKTKIEELQRHHESKIFSLKKEIAQNANKIGMDEGISKIKSEMRELNHEECKQEKAECIKEKEELRKDIQQLSEQKASLNLKYTTCNSERPAHSECKEDKKKCLKETRDLKSDMAALDVKYAKCDTERDDCKQCKVDKRELERIYKKLEAELNALNIEAVRLNITHSYDNKEIKACDRRLHDSNVKMLEYMEKYVTCLKDKDSTNTEPQKICKIELAECLANLRQVIDTSSECQDKLARCIWC